MSNRYDVVIVGGGTAGLSVAARLRQELEPVVRQAVMDAMTAREQDKSSR